MTVNNETIGNEKEPAHGGISIRIIGAIAIVIAILLAFYAFSLASRITDVEADGKAAEERYVNCDEAVDDLMAASDFLTSQARMFVVTGRRSYMDAYINELDDVNRRGNALQVLKANSDDDSLAAKELEEALAASDKLAESELVAMNLAASYYNFSNVPDEVANANLSPADKSLTGNAQLEAARALVLGSDYDAAKDRITENVEASSDALLSQLTENMEENESLMQALLFQLRISVALLLCVVMVLVLVLFLYVLKPLDRYVKRIQKNEPLEADGAYELHYLANAYNAMYEDNSKRIEQLRQFAERDPLTGIANRNGYENFLATHTRNIALLLIDIDNFKEFNNVYGHDTGDAVMVKLANALSTAFRSTDFPCRLRSDKFAVIMTNTNADLRDAISSKVELVNSMLADDSDDLPLITLSVGAAFSAEGMDDHDIYAAAYEALLKAQEQGRNGMAFYGESNVV